MAQGVDVGHGGGHFGGAHGHQLQPHQPLRRDLRVVAVAEANGDVDPGALELGRAEDAVTGSIHRMQAGLQAHFSVGADGVEAMQPRHDPLRGEQRFGAHGDDQALFAVGADLVHRAPQGLKPLMQLWQSRTRGRGQADPPVVADEQLDAQILLERLDLVTDRRGGDVQLLGRRSEALGARGDLEVGQCDQRWES